MTCIVIIPTLIINSFLSKLYIFSLIIQYFFISNINYIKLIFISNYYLIIYISANKIIVNKAHTLFFFYKLSILWKYNVFKYVK